MTQKQMIEEIQLSFPEAGETLITALLNKALHEIVEDSRILTNVGTVTLISGQRYYDFSDFTNVKNDRDVLEVFRVDVTGKPISRFTGEISETALT